jgi:hypothetical protein
MIWLFWTVMFSLGVEGMSTGAMGRLLPVVMQKNPMIFELWETQTQTRTETLGH